ncbi:MAG: hypothetical protein V3U73_05045, partial [bacterium]
SKPLKSSRPRIDKVTSLEMDWKLSYLKSNRSTLSGDEMWKSKPLKSSRPRIVEVASLKAA